MTLVLPDRKALLVPQVCKELPERKALKVLRARKVKLVLSDP